MPSARVTERPARHWPPWPIILLLVAWVLPWTLMLGNFKLTPYRVALLILIVPSLVRWATGKAGRLRIADLALLLFGVWAIVGLMVLHGPQIGIQTGGVLFLETIGAYFVARSYVRNADDFYGLVRVLFWIVALLLPFAIIETITGRNIILEFFSSIMPTHPVSAKEPRWGLRRVQAIFEHPILMGVCCGCILAMTHLVLGRGESAARRWTGTGIVALTAALSLSSGPWSGMAAQMLLLGWNWALGNFKPRWKLLLSLLAGVVLAIQLLAKRPLPDILFSAFAFDPQSAFFRILIWDYGTQSVANHPWFGVGLGQWDRPSWMPPSIDMFWLYNAIIYGLPAGLLMFAAFLAVIIPVSLLKNLDDRLYQYRAGFLMSMTALFLMGWMVHYWNATYVLFLLLLGSGVWLLDASPKGAAGMHEPSRSQRLRPARGRQRSASPRGQRAAADLIEAKGN